MRINTVSLFEIEIINKVMYEASIAASLAATSSQIFTNTSMYVYSIY